MACACSERAPPSSVAVLTAGPGIGANTAIFSLVNSVLLGTLPYKDADRLAIRYGEPA